MNRAGSNCRRVTRPAKVSGGLTCDKGLNRNDKSRSFCSSYGYSPTGEPQGWREEGYQDAGSGLAFMLTPIHYPTTVR